MRKRLFEIIESAGENDRVSAVYDWFMMIVIVASIVPLGFKNVSYRAFRVMDKVCVAIFILDYLLRWLTADYKFNRHTVWSFIRYPFSAMALIDLLCILPSFSFIGRGFRVLKLARLFRTLRVFRAFKFVRYSKSIRIILDVIKGSEKPLLTVFALAISYIVICALIIFNVEPETFGNFFEAVYWATVSLTTVGYGDIYPVSVAGRCITMLSAFVGVAIVALPAGIITAGYMDALQKSKHEKAHGEEHTDNREEESGHGSENA